MECLARVWFTLLTWTANLWTAGDAISPGGPSRLHFCIFQGDTEGANGWSLQQGGIRGFLEKPGIRGNGLFTDKTLG